MNDSNNAGNTGAIKYMTKEELEAGLDHIRRSPDDDGVLEMVVRRPGEGEREVLEEGNLSTALGLEGDNWSTRPNRHTPDNSPHPEMQLNIMNARCIDLITQDKERWKLAGDQLYVDFNLSEANIPPGTRLSIGSAVVEVTAIPHNGCKKFMKPFRLCRIDVRQFGPGQAAPSSRS